MKIRFANPVKQRKNKSARFYVRIRRNESGRTFGDNFLFVRLFIFSPAGKNQMVCITTISKERGVSLRLNYQR
jgi:hypothetical protein